MTLLLLICYLARLLPTFSIALCDQKAVDKLSLETGLINMIVVVFGQMELHAVTVFSVISQLPVHNI